MTFAACAVVPCYNHGDTVAGVVARLRAQGIEVVVVDDGSEATAAQSVRALAAVQGVHVFRLAENSGKGAAVLRGMREAAALGFSHALQVDADGQHCIEDAGRFLEAARRAPGAVICGVADFDESAPKARLYGRYVTHFWVWIETLSFAVGDSMCGYRIYPLEPTLALADRERIASRMNFDIDIVVRLYWEGLPVRNLRTRVVYPPGGRSHFRLLRDNLRISATHARLFFGMLWRLPRLLAARRRVDRGSLHWSRLAERGSRWGLRLVAAAFGALGPRAARAVLFPAVLYFYLTEGSARRASRTYLARLHAHSGGRTPRPTTLNVLRHMLAFAHAGVDKLAAWRGAVAASAISFDGSEALDDLRRSGRGALFIGAHLGNLEMMRALAVTRRLENVTAVVYTHHARRFAEALESAHAGFRQNLMEVSDFGPQTAIAMRERIERGEILVIVGDRTPPADNGRWAKVSFLGHEAPFPLGPVILAHLLECQVFLFFCLKQGDGYRACLEPFAERIVLPPRQRAEVIDVCIRRYAACLERHCVEAPMQWFNFFDFWHEPVRGS